MISRDFSLIPSPSSTLPLHIGISVSVSRRDSVLSLTYRLAGSLAGLVIPQREAMPGRRDRLWEKTCFEFFAGPAGSEGYWEFNISPSGNWNAYRFNSYRTGMQEEPAAGQPELCIDSAPELLILSAELNLGRIIRQEQAVEVGISAVVEGAEGEISYWALIHPGPRPDFHRREAFILKL